ncbi:cytochrome b561 [Roseiarcus fermentans]|uniref:Cytochrome b561 n=1 Tax=Roseiarcus fermentans TaxID=1473586 RepID=A0A366EQ88_9HYPH|nr:cytochrome b [Roseiarcus fermentans]RBP04548.1 cytochrome b561 [Roseiarcus fermentans]
MKSYTPAQFIAVYNPAFRTLHWLMALLILIGLGLGVWASQLPKGDLRSEILFVHKSFGVAVLALVVIRILARLVLGLPAYPAPLGRLTEIAAGGAHAALYVLMIALPISGWVMSGFAGREVSFFGLYTLPQLVSENKELAGRAALAHEVLAWAIGVVIAVHLLAVVWHVVVKRDAVLTRMWPRWTPART